MADNAPETRPYELMILFSPELNEDALSAGMTRVNGTVESAGATVDNVKNTTPWGRRRLAYPIKGFRDATYVLYDVSCPPDTAYLIERDLRINEEVIRYMLVHKEDEPEDETTGEDALVDRDDADSDSSAEESTSGDASATESSADESASEDTSEESAEETPDKTES